MWHAGLRKQLTITGNWKYRKKICHNHDWFVRKAVNANPRLKVKARVPFFLWKCFPLLMFCVVWHYSSSKLKDKLQYKQQTLLKTLQKWIQNSRYSWVRLIWLWTIRPSLSIYKPIFRRTPAIQSSYAFFPRLIYNIFTCLQLWEITR